MSDGYLFVIDTDSYAGNFERQMTAYLTGKIGDCGVGSEFVRYFESEVGSSKDHFDNIEQREDEGCFRPCSIYPTPGYANNGLGGHYKLGDKAAEKASLKAYKQNETEYHEKNIARVEDVKKKLLAGERVSSWTIEGCDQEIARFQEQISLAKKKKKVAAYPAYQSVAIYFYSQPTKKQITLLKERAEKFVKVYQEIENARHQKYGMTTTARPIQILGFRLVQETTTAKSIAV